MNPPDDPTGIPAVAEADASALAPATRLPEINRPSPPVWSDRARRLRRTLSARKTTSLGAALVAQGFVLDALFNQLLLEDAGGAGFDEAFGLALALRTQKQFRNLYETIENIQHRNRKT